MIVKRFSSLQSVICLSTVVLLWLAWSNVRLRDDETDGSANRSNRKNGSGGYYNGNNMYNTGYSDEILDADPNHFQDHDESKLPYTSDRTTSALETLKIPFTIVTAASSNHFCALESFLYSLSELMEGLERTELRPKLVVYNLGGMTPEQLAQLEKLKQDQYMDEYHTFDYAAYPAFWDITVARGEYGWKAGIIQEVADANRGLVLWLDSGNMLALDFLRYIPGYLKEYGFWSPQSSGNFEKYTHPGLPEFFGETLEMYAQEPNCNGAALAFDASNPDVYNGLLKDWVQCSMNKECIAPKGSSRDNHRQDQAALTYLVHRRGMKEQCRHYPEHYGVTVHQDKVCKERIRAYKIMKGMDEHEDDAVMDEEDDEEEGTAEENEAQIQQELREQEARSNIESEDVEA